MSLTTSEICTGQKVGLLAACIAVAVAMVPIASHREHTEAVAQRKTYPMREAVLDVGLVLCSIYFISKRRIFPPMGVAVALLGAGEATPARVYFVNSSYRELR